MYKDHKIRVIVPAYNEEKLITDTLRSIPVFVDSIFVINDASSDNTFKLILDQKEKDKRIDIIDHKKNMGLGQSLIDGYIASRDSNMDITAVMAGDNQMHPDDLPRLLDKIVDEKYDYVKGNRLLHQDAKKLMPRYRYFGNAVLTILSKFASGYFYLMDPQCGYTVIKNECLKMIPIEKMTRRYGYNADILCMLNIYGFKVADVMVRPVYGKEKSRIKLWIYIPKMSYLLIKLFLRRMWKRYVILDFHPLVLFYLFAIFNSVFIILPFLVRLVTLYKSQGSVPRTTLMILIFTFLITFQSILFALWMDMDYNKRK